MNPHTAAFDLAIARSVSAAKALRQASACYWEADRRDPDAPSFKTYVAAREAYAQAQEAERLAGRRWWLFEERGQ